MIVAVLTVTALSLAVIMLGAHLARGWVRDTIELLTETRAELRPAVVTVRSQAQRSAALRAALIEEQSPRPR